MGQDIKANDVEGIFTSSNKSIWGDDIADSVGKLECSLTSMSLASFAQEFRSICDAAIHRTLTVGSGLAQAVSLLLDHGNEKLLSLERSSPPTDPAVDPAEAEDPFWMAVMPDISSLLLLQACRGMGLGCAASLFGQESGEKRKRKKAYYGDIEEDLSEQKSGKKRLKRVTDGHRWTSGPLPATVTVELVELLKGLEAALSLHVQLESPPHDTGSAGPVHFDQSAGTGSPAFSHLKSLQERVEAARKSQLARVQNCQAVRAACVLPLDFANLVSELEEGSYGEADSITEELTALSRSAAERLANDSETERRSKLLAIADNFAAVVNGAIVAVVSAARGSSGNNNGQTSTQRMPRPVVAKGGALPECIQANREPYLQGDWRREPYIPRPYVRLQKYEIAEEKDTLEYKFRTEKKGKCSGQHCTQPGHLGTYVLEAERFQTGCDCLARNLECGPDCGCAGTAKCLNRAVTERRTLVLGRDVLEINSWGFDCYTRRNIHDAVLESGAFGEHQPVTLQEALRQPDNINPLDKGEVVHHNTAPQPLKTAASEEAQKSSGGADNSTLGRSSATVPDLQAKVTAWVERELMPAINRQGDSGWDIMVALEEVKERAQAEGDTQSIEAAKAVEKRVQKVGSNYFRIHPKGVGLMCNRAEGLPPLTFVEEYLGEVHTPWRWFEMQDIIRKTMGDELPDFYNIVLERPRDDPTGYDVLFIDAAAKGAFASRMSHSCTPNCQAVVMACGGRLTIAVYTLRHVCPGEELTFDYACVTESEKEFKTAICLCGTRNCRGSFLMFAGSRAFMQIMTQRHAMLRRQALLLRAGCEPLTEEDKARLQEFGLRECALGGGGGQPRVPAWLEKWTALILEFVQEEQRLLPEQLLALPSNIAAYTPFTAASEAKGVSDNRLQNVVITLDKVKLCLNKPGQCQNAPLRLLAESEVVEYLWTGTKSVARRLLRAAASELASPTVARALSSAEDADDIQEVLAKHRGQKHLEEVAVLVTQPAADAAEARSRLMALAEKMRALDVALGGGHTAAADMLLLFASTQTWFTSERDYKGFTSPPVKLNLSDLMLKRAVGPGVAAVPRKDQAPPPSMGLSEAVAQDSAPLADAHMATAMTASGEAAAEALTAVVEGEEAGGAGQAADAVLSVGPPASVGTQKAKASKGAASRRNGPEKQSKVGLAKRYGAGFVWGQLNGWYKQTVFDPTASLSAERRGTISLPDIESCYGGARSRYTVKDRNHLIDHIEKRPEGLWKIGTNWSFRNEGKIYGSPMFDAVWAETVAAAPANPMPEVLRKLKSAHLPRASENARAPAEEDSD
ncbi:g7352 [Coccomyxa elongata]